MLSASGLNKRAWHIPLCTRSISSEKGREEEEYYYMEKILCAGPKLHKKFFFCCT
jgi:hypothetical protein